MVYLLTSVLTKPDGRTCFNPTTDTEVFGTYFAALRWLVRERRSLRRVTCDVWSETPTYRSKFGRETLFCLCYTFSKGSVTRLTISRITTTGVH